MTLAVQGNSAWVACKEQSRVIRVDTISGKTVKSVRLGGPAIAVASGFSSIWALDSAGTLYRLNRSSGKVVKRVPLRVSAAYNIFLGGGSVWVADDQGMAWCESPPHEQGRRAIAGRRRPGRHGIQREHGLGDQSPRPRADPDQPEHEQVRATRVVAGDAPERMVWAKGRLWITGRGTDLLKVDPANGSVEGTIEIGASGIDVVADGDNLWVPTRSAAVDQSGLPTLDALQRVSIASGSVSTVVRATGSRRRSRTRRAGRVRLDRGQHERSSSTACGRQVGAKCPPVGARGGAQTCREVRAIVVAES